MTAAVVAMNPDDFTIRSGQSAWADEKRNVKAQRERWVRIGRALLVGRKLNPADRDFHTWIKDHGFGDIERRTRADAMWLAEIGLSGVPAGDTESGNPKHIRQAWREAQAQQAPWDGPSDLSELPPATQAPALPKREAEKVAKLIHRANSGDEGADIAKRHVKAVAERHEH